MFYFQMRTKLSVGAALKSIVTLTSNSSKSETTVPRKAMLLSVLLQQVTKQPTAIHTCTSTHAHAPGHAYAHIDSNSIQIHVCFGTHRPYTYHTRAHACLYTQSATGLIKLAHIKLFFFYFFLLYIFLDSCVFGDTWVAVSCGVDCAL